MFYKAKMEPELLLSSPKATASTSLPLFLSYNLPFVKKPKFCVKSHLSLSTIQAEKSQFFGKSLIFTDKIGSFGSVRKPHIPFEPVSVVKRRKELPFDNVIQKDKKLKLVLKIRKILVSQPDRIMSLKQLGKFRKDLGLDKKPRFIALLRKFPAIFEIVEEGIYSLMFKLTPEAERLYLEEMKVRNEMEDLLVTKLRKLLMMSLEKRILLEKIAHLRTDLGLPVEFRDTICHRFPQNFRVVATKRGPALELTQWDPELAMSAAELSEEENRATKLRERKLIIDRPLKFNTVKMPKGLNLSKSELRKICQFRDMPYISPYSEFSGLKSGTLEKEKHAAGVVHEILSLTVEKKTLVDNLTHFREEFRFSQQVRGMLIRHPDMFYVSLKGDRDSVFLREAYRDSQLIDKDRLLIIKEKLRTLVDVPRFRKRGAPKNDTDVDGSEDGEEWSDIDDYMTDSQIDDDDYGDDWSDDDDTPPDFEEDDGTVKIGSSKSAKQVNGAMKNEEKALVLEFPDGRPRECW